MNQALILLMGLSDLSGLREAAAHALRVVGIGGDDEVRAARREFAGLDNVMFTQGDRHDIPWQNAQFTVIVDQEGGEPTVEMRRVLVAGGRIIGSLADLEP